MRENLLGAVQGEPLCVREFGREADEYMALHRAHMQRESEQLLPLVERLLHKLQELADACGVTTESGGLLLDAPLTVQDLAGSLGCSRQWASKLLSEIESRGLIERRGRRIVLTEAALEHSSG